MDGKEIHPLVGLPLADGEDIETVRQLGGWRDYSTVLRYVEAIPERRKAAADRQLGKYQSRHFSRQLGIAKKSSDVNLIKSNAPVAQQDRAVVS